MNHQEKMLGLLGDLLDYTRQKGASDADVILSESTSLSVSRRQGKAETLERAEEGDIGLRVLVGQKQAVVSSSDPSWERLKEMADRAIMMAGEVPEDPWLGLATPDQLAKDWPQDLDLFDATELSVEQMAELADRTEAAALQNAGVTNSEGAEMSLGQEQVYYLATNGFQGAFQSSGFSLSASVIAGTGEAMQSDYDYDASGFFGDLRSPEAIGQRAAERAVSALNARKGKTCQVPVVFDERVSASLVGALAGAANGMAVARGTSMLKDKMEQQIFAKGITIVDDPFIHRGARSHPFDAEGLLPQKRNIVEDGVLQGWFLDLATARKLGMTPTGNASRGTSSPPRPRPSNLYMLNGDISRDDMIADIKDGFLVTKMMSSNVNLVTGDYGRGASGFWIENGKISYPVNEVTIAGNLKDMWMNITAANDLEIRHGTDAPTLRIDKMTVAGE